MINPRDDIRVEFDNPDFQLPGWPGYRTRPGRSGYDSLDYIYERYHVQGRVISSFLRRDWHTSNLFYLVLLNLFGLFSLLFGIVLLYSTTMFWARIVMDMGSEGATSLIVVYSAIYLIIGFGFREIDAILQKEVPEP